MSKYIKEIEDFSRLNPKEGEILLFKKNHGNLQAKRLLINHNLNKVISFAIEMQGDIDFEIDELINIGACGLIEAVDNYKGCNYDELEKNINLSIQKEFKNCLITLNNIDNNPYGNYEQLNEKRVPFNEELIKDDQEPIEDIVVNTIALEEYNSILNLYQGNSRRK